MTQKDIKKGARYLSKKDAVLKEVIRKVGDFPIPYSKSTPFDKLARSIVGQQLSRHAAKTIWERVNTLYPKRRRLHPDDILKTSDAKLRSCGLSAAKVLSIKDLARYFESKKITPQKLARASEEEVVKLLTQVRGIGEWTAHMFLMFGQGRTDILPLGDLGFRNGFAHAYKKKGKVTEAEIAKKAERWRPYRSVATLYLWRYLDLK